LLIPPRIPVEALPAKADPTLGHPRVEAAFNTILILAFLAGLYLPFQGVFRGGAARQIEEQEGRKAAAFPELEFKNAGPIRRPDTNSLKAFPGQFEKWFNDRIGFRRPLIQVFQVARYYGWTPRLLSTMHRQSHAAASGVMNHLDQGAATHSSDDGVLIGRDGWLYYKSESALDDFRGTDLFTDAELSRWKDVLTERRQWLAKKGIRYVFVIVPNKSAIYPEYMPGSVTRVTEESRLGQLENYLKRHSDIEFLNLSETLRDAKTDCRVFHKTDAHWNAYGAFAGARSLLGVLQAGFPEIRVPEMGDYEMQVHDCCLANVKTVSPWVKMDLAVMLGSPIPQKEEVIDLVPLRTDDQVPIQFYGPPRSESERLRRHACERGEISNVYVLHDSCMMALAPFLAPHFKEATYNWTHDFPAEEIEQARPVLVIQQMVQRKLMTHEPKNPKLVTEDPVR
jgi:hypothetical protein